MPWPHSRQVQVLGITCCPCQGEVSLVLTLSKNPHNSGLPETLTHQYEETHISLSPKDRKLRLGLRDRMGEKSTWNETLKEEACTRKGWQGLREVSRIRPSARVPA